MRRVEVVAFDHDRTLTDLDLVVRPDTLAALAEARAAGLLLVAVSGRDAAFLRSALGDAVDLLVAENGAYVVDPRDGAAQPLFRRWPGAAALDAIGVPLEHAAASANADAADAARLAAGLARLGLPVRIERNVDRVMLVPPGVGKGAGLRAALRGLGVPPRRAAAVGDGENDVSLLAAAGWRVAVANAVPAVKALAHEVTRRPGGEGVADWLRERAIPGAHGTRGRRHDATQV